MKENILIIDFGSQYTQLIARRIREQHVYCEIIPYNKITNQKLITLNPKGVVLSGGPTSVNVDKSPRVPDLIWDLNIPVLGICYGMQVMATQFGGKVETSERQEFGYSQIEVTHPYNLLFYSSDNAGYVTNTLKVWMSHGDHVVELPNDFKILASSNGMVAAIGNMQRRYFGLQFHPEVTHTQHGKEIIKNFVFNVCGCNGTWTMHSFKEEAIRNIRREVGSKHVICALSGGVDSSVTALILYKAVGDNLTCFLIDNGLLRASEVKEVVEMFKEHYHIPLIVLDKKEKFLNALYGVTNPESKRRIIGLAFIESFEEAAQEIPNAEFLAQGTLYPDVIESRSFHGGPSSTIKSHHNVGGLPETMNLKLIEPLRELFKDEVRVLGKELGLTEKFIGRHPFPGPGLAIRILGEVTKERLEILRKADKIFIDELRKHDLYNHVWQAFVVLLPVNSVGVMGDNRTYENACVLRAVSSIDGMTAKSSDLPHEFLCHVATKIVNEVRGINRVTYDITSKPPATIEWE